MYMAKEAYFNGKRGLFTWQKRPIYISIAHHAARAGLSVQHILYTVLREPILYTLFREHILYIFLREHVLYI